MSILVNKDSKILVQGIGGEREARRDPLKNGNEILAMGLPPIEVAQHAEILE